MCIIWNHCHRTHVDSIEVIQRHFLNYCLSKSERLFTLWFCASAISTVHTISLQNFEIHYLLSQYLANISIYYSALSITVMLCFYLHMPRTFVITQSHTYNIFTIYNKASFQLDMLYCNKVNIEEFHFLLRS